MVEDVWYIVVECVDSIEEEDTSEAALVTKRKTPVKLVTYRKHLVYIFRHVLVVHFEQINGLLEWLKHDVCGVCAVFDSNQMAHALHQCIIVTFWYVFA